MVNRHFGKAGDVWKHLLLATVLDGMEPSRYAETHAGSASNAMDDLPERRYGVWTYLDRVADHPDLDRSPYTHLVRHYLHETRSVYPGSPLIALELLHTDADVLLCDLDPDSAANLRREAQRLGRDHCRVVESDGMSAVADWLPTSSEPALVHVDPFDPHARAEGGHSALERAAHVADVGAGLAYWYGYDNPDEQAWALHELASLTRTPLVCLDMGVRDTQGRGHRGHLGRATTPGTGFGHVLANIPDPVVDRCARLGTDLAQMYDGLPLPDGTPASWQLTVHHAPQATGPTA